MQILEITAQHKFVSSVCQAHSNAHNPPKTVAPIPGFPYGVQKQQTPGNFAEKSLIVEVLDYSAPAKYTQSILIKFTLLYQLLVE